MDRVRTNATLFAEHSARIKRSYAALDTRVVSRFTVTRDRLSSYFSSFLSIFSFLPSRSCSLHLPFALSFDPFSRTLGGWTVLCVEEIPFFFFLKNCWFNFSEKREIQWLLFLDWIFFDSYLIKGRMVLYIPFFLVQFLKSWRGLVSFILILHPKNYIFFLAASSLLTSFSSFLKFLTKQCHSSFFVVPSSISLLDSLYFLLKILLL